MSTTTVDKMLIRNQVAAKRIATEAYPYACCVICGFQMRACLTVAHLDHRPGNNDPENLAFFCHTHHWMFDSGLYPLDGVKVLRAHWQQTKGIACHKARMNDAGAKAALTRKRSGAARKAWETRRKNGESAGAATSEIVGKTS